MVVCAVESRVLHWTASRTLVSLLLWLFVGVGVAVAVLLRHLTFPVFTHSKTDVYSYDSRICSAVDANTIARAHTHTSFFYYCDHQGARSALLLIKTRITHHPCLYFFNDHQESLVILERVLTENTYHSEAVGGSTPNDGIPFFATAAPGSGSVASAVVSGAAGLLLRSAEAGGFVTGWPFVSGTPGSEVWKN